MEEKKAIDLLKHSDLSGLEYLVNQYYYQAVRSAYLIVREKAQAEDIVQNFFLDLPKKIASFDDAQAIKPWLLKCIVNASLNSLSERTRITSLDDKTFADEDFFRELADTYPLPEDQVITAEVHQAVWKSLGKLTPNQRAVIVMRYYLQLDEAEMAEKMKKPRSSIKWWLHSAKKRLSSLLHPFKAENVNKNNPYLELKANSKESDYE